VVKSCQELEVFDFGCCRLVSNATIQAALDAVKLRTSSIKLKLVVRGELKYSVDISIFFICIHGNRFIDSK
jgi:hypothetical protein